VAVESVAVALAVVVVEDVDVVVDEVTRVVVSVV
jgi:hypothetical protein